MRDKKEVSIAVVGDLWPDEQSPQEELWRTIERVYRRYVDYNFLSLSVMFPTKPSKVEFFPHSLGSGFVIDAIKSQELRLARAADVTVYINSGGWNEAKKAYLDKLLSVATSLVVWTPSGVKEDLPEGGVSDHKPGLVVGKGSMSVLAQLVVFLVLPSDDFLFIEPDVPTKVITKGIGSSEGTKSSGDTKSSEGG